MKIQKDIYHGGRTSLVEKKVPGRHQNGSLQGTTGDGQTW